MTLFKRKLATLYAIPGFKVIFELLFVILPIAFLIRTFGFGLYQVPSGSMETTLLVGERFLADKLSYWFTNPKHGDIIAFDDPRYSYSDNLIQNTWQRYVSWNVTNWTKRVIGVPKDRIQGLVENGRPVIYRNGVKLDEPYINKYPLIEVRENSWYTSGRGRDTVTKSFDPSMPYDKQPFYTINPASIKRSSWGDPIIIEPATVRDADVFDVTLKDNQYWVMGDNRLGSFDSREWGPLNANLIHGKIVFCIFSTDSEDSWWFIDLLKHPIDFWKKVRWNRCLKWIK